MTSNNDNELINSDSTDKGTDQPRVVELTTIPKEGVELQFIKGNELNKVNINDKTNIKESKTLIYLKKEKTLYIKLVSPSQMTRRAFVRELGLEEDIKNYVQKCEKCQKEKYSRYTKEPMTITTTATEAFQNIYGRRWTIRKR
ncbi:hypothetical protein HF086_004792 [Spodoptera exigua]|uniref:Uncharacterized protein n=1 Tax=Spodoptera exigua TaxID=7107 RepID=A0A922M466_SPOEX|nr:hypothetical protein HF086_004792 [Spodoptera exigua]